MYDLPCDVSIKDKRNPKIVKIILGLFFLCLSLCMCRVLSMIGNDISIILLCLYKKPHQRQGI